MSKLLDIVIVGIGHSHAEGVVGELKFRSDLFNIVGIVENDENVLKEKINLKTFHKIKLLKEEDVLNGKFCIDGIVIEEVMERIVPACKKYLALHVPIHADKPTGLNNEFIDYVDDAEKLNIPIQIGYMYRYEPAILELKKYIANNKVGEISQFDVTMDTDLSVNDRKNLIRPYTGGSMYVFGSHIIDIVTSVMGFPEKTDVYLGKSGFDNLDIVDNSIALLYYKKCCAVVKSNVVSAGGYLRRHMLVSGQNGAIYVEPMEKPTKMNYTYRKPGGNGGDESKIEPVEVDLDKYNYQRRYQFMIENFAYMIKGETDKMYVKVDYAYEKNLHNLLLEIVGVK